MTIDELWERWTELPPERRCELLLQQEKLLKKIDPWLLSVAKEYAKEMEQ